MKTRQLVKDETIDKQITEMADSHCHLDLLTDDSIIKDAITNGVKTMVTNGIDTKSNISTLELADGRNVFAMLGIDPEHSGLSDDELEFNIKTIKQNAAKIVGIGEIGLDYGRVMETVNADRQMVVFGQMLDMAKQLRLPVSVHSRDALDDVFQMLHEKSIEMVHIHFFEGNVQQAKEAERRGYMISIPPIESERRSKVIKEIAIDNIMAESDAPAVGLSPRDVYRSIGMVSVIKKVEFNKAADLLTQNTKRFFKTNGKGKLMRF